MAGKAQTLPVKERLKQFENSTGSSSPPSPTASKTSSMRYGGSEGGRNKEESAPREKRTDSRHRTGPVASNSKGLEGQRGPRYAQDSSNILSSSNPDLQASYGFSTSQTGLTGSDGTGQTITNWNVANSSSHVHQTDSSQSGVLSTPNLSKVESEIHDHSADEALHRTPQTYGEEGVAHTKVGVSENTSETPPTGLKIAVAIPSRHDRLMKSASQDEAATVTSSDNSTRFTPVPPKQKPPLLPNRNVRMVKEQHAGIPPHSLGTSGSSDTIFLGKSELNNNYESPPLSPHQGIGSGGPSSNQSQYSSLTNPQEVHSMDCPSKLPGSSGHNSFVVNTNTGKVGTGKLLHIHSQSSSSSECSDKVVGLEDSIPIGIMTGEQKLASSIVINLRQENEDLRHTLANTEEQLAESNKIISLGTVISKSTTSEEPIPEISGTYDSQEFEQGHVGDNVMKLVGTNISLVTDDKGVPISQRRRRLSQKEQDLHKKVTSLESQLSMKQTELDVLKNENQNKDDRIKVLRQTIETNKTTAQRGIRDNFADQYIDQVTQLTSQLSVMDEKVKVQSMEITELELKQSKTVEVYNLLKSMFREKKKLLAQVDELAEEKTRLSRHTAELHSSSDADGEAPTTIEASKVSDLEDKGSELEKKLKDCKQDADSRVMEKETELSNLEAHIQSLNAMLQVVTEEKDALHSQLQNTQTVQHDVVIKSQQLDKMLAETEEINIQREMVLKEKENELEAKSKEIERLKVKMERMEVLNTKLRKHVTSMTVATPVLSNRKDQENAGDDVTDAQPKLAEQELHIKELEKKIEHLEIGEASLREELEKGQAHIDKLSTDHVQIIDHVKQLSKKIVDYKSSLNKLLEQKVCLESELEASSKQNQQLLTDWTQMEKALQDSQMAISQHEADLKRIRTDRDNLRKANSGIEELEKSNNFYQQKTIGQQAMLENGQAELGDLRRKLTRLTDEIEKKEVEISQMRRELDSASGELEAHRVMAQTFEEDFNAERKDREQAHSMFVDKENQFADQIQTLTKQIQAKDAENIRIKQMAGQKNQLEARVSELSYEIGDSRKFMADLKQENMTLQEDIQIKTQQVRQYKKQVDQFRTELNAHEEQAEIHRQQVETKVSEADTFRHERDQLQTRVRFFEAGVDPRSSQTSAQFRQDMEAAKEHYLKQIDDLTLSKTMLASELDELKKQMGMAIHQTPPITSSAAIRPQPKINPSQRGAWQVQSPHTPSSRLPHQHTSQPSHRQQQTQPMTGQSGGDNYSSRGSPLNHNQLHLRANDTPVPQAQLNQRRRNHTADLSLSNQFAPTRAGVTAERFNPGISREGGSSRVSNSGYTQPPHQQQQYPHNNTGTGTNTVTSDQPQIRPQAGASKYSTYENLPMNSSGPASLPLSPTFQTQYGGSRSNDGSQVDPHRPSKDFLFPSQGRNLEQNRSPEDVEKDSPPSSMQPSSLNLQQTSNSQMQRAKFANRPPGISQSTDGYLQGSRPPLHSGSRQEKSVFTPHLEGSHVPPMHGLPRIRSPVHSTHNYHAASPPYPGVTNATAQPRQVASQTQFRGGGGNYGNQHVPTSARVKYPQQESKEDILREGERLPRPLINHSPNVYNPELRPGAGHQGGGASHQGGGVSQPRGGVSYQTGEVHQSLRSKDVPIKRDELSSKTEDRSVSLDRGIDDEIAQIAKGLEHSDPPSVSSDRGDVPFDPNLVCPYCQTQFRLGEIQKFKRHASTCVKKK